MSSRRTEGRRAGFAATLSALMLLACSGQAAAGQKDGTVTITDRLGRTVAVRGPVDRIISLEPEITRIIVALGEGKRLVGLDYFLRHHDHAFPLIFPLGRELPLVSNPGQELALEEAIRLRPDVLFVSPSEVGMATAIERKIGAPVVALASMGRFAHLIDEIEILGRLIERQERAASLVDVIRSRLDAVTRRSSPAGPQSRPSVYLAFWGSLVRTPVFYEALDVAGGRNVAAGLLPSHLGSAAASVSIEKILVWDPDVILIQGNYRPGERAVTVESVLGDPRLNSLRAVRTGRVHYTYGFWYWWDPALVLAEILYLSRLLHPDGSPNFDLLGEGEAIFREFYHTPGAFRRLYEILECHAWAGR